jgi:aminoglycoside 6'-N-acetyltransferase I
MKIFCEDLKAGDAGALESAAEILVAAFTHFPDTWDTIEEARQELREALEPGKICLAARDEAGRLLGWIGGQHTYSMVWELHPLAVHPDFQRQGVGAALVAALEERIQAAGGLTVTLGTDDEIDGTNLYGRELYPDVLGAAQQIAVTNGHPYAFYQKLGYVITGLIPDANGFGRPDIIMCKRLRPESGGR